MDTLKPAPLSNKNHRPNRSFAVPPGVGEALHYVIARVSTVYSWERPTAFNIAKHILRTVKSLVSAEFFEMFYVENQVLVPVNKRYPLKSFELSNKSLLGSVGQSRLFQIFNNPHNSTLYAQFTEKTLPFNKRTQKLALPHNICAVPLCFPQSEELFGVIIAYNKHDHRSVSCPFAVNDVHIMQSIGLLLTGQLKLYSRLLMQAQEQSNSSEGSQLVAYSHRSLDRFQQLQKWYKRIFLVNNAFESKQLAAKTALQQIYSDPTPQTLIKAALQVLSSLTNSESARIGVLYNKQHCLIAADGSVQIATEDERELLQGCLETGRPVAYGGEYGRTNLLLYPFKRTEGAIVIELLHKLNETQTKVLPFNHEDETVIETLAPHLFPVVYASLTDCQVPLTELRDELKTLILSMNCQPVISIIRRAAQSLLHCDRATVFVREASQMTVQYQGHEQELPVGFSIPIGKGIVGYVASTGIRQNITDAYKDTRFNREVDVLTGYRTQSVLCAPVLNSRQEVIAALQMINKHGGVFDETDEETLELLAEMVSSVLVSSNLFTKAVEERTRLMNILNRIATYVIVLNGDGKLEYSNRDVKPLLGIDAKEAAEKSYQSWLKPNRQLVLDITEIFQGATERTVRERVNVYPTHSTYHWEPPCFDYTVLAPNEVSGEAAGAIIILEDSTTIEELSAKCDQMQQQLEVLSAKPVQAVTSLQKCVGELEALSNSLPAEVSSALRKIASTLKCGNLDKAEITVPTELRGLETSIRKRIKEFIEEPVAGSAFEPSPRPNRLSLGHSVHMSGLADWNFDYYQVDDHAGYVKAMFGQFDLHNEFSIDLGKLDRFVARVQENYQAYFNPYHNFFHGMTVLHTTYMVLQTTRAGELFNALEVFALLLSSLCHDVGHTGRTNLFEINSQSSLATVYNDVSVLENHHAALTFKLMQNTSCNILEQLSPSSYKVLRNTVVKCILGTDMAKHFQMVSELTERLKELSAKPMGSLEGDNTKAAAYIVHCADLAHPTKNFEQFSKWSRLVCEEFTRQVTEEQAMGLPVTEFMVGLDEDSTYYKNEVGFLTAIIKPLWTTLDLWLSPQLDEQLENIESNLATYKARLDSCSE